MARLGGVVVAACRTRSLTRGDRRQERFFCEEELRRLRENERTGRPLGEEESLEHLEWTLGRVVRHKKRGRKRKECKKKGMVSPEF
jgi:hypothetical protein